MSRHARVFPLGLAVCALVAAAGGIAYGDSQRGAQPDERGNHNGGPPDFVCERLQRITLPNGRTLCTHGPDPVEALPGESVTAAARAEAPWPCYTTGPAYHSLYVRSATQISRLPTLRTFFETSMRHVQGEFEVSATDNGGPGKLLRVLTDGFCNLVIDEVVVSGSAMSDFRTMISELQYQGYNEADRKYLIWADAYTYCGIGTLMPDDRKSPFNRNNSSVSYARVDTRCWDNAESHEIAHNLGAVQNSAPHSSGGYHCYDEYDHMCYRDGGRYFTNGGALVGNCPETRQNLMLDCMHDDYYDATGQSPYLATHWNVATDSRYLIETTIGTTVPPTTTIPTTVPSTTTPPPSSTSSTSTSTTSTTVPNVPAIVYSSASNRVLPAPLSNATVRGDLYVFVINSGDISRADFWFDNPSMTGPPRHSETLAPYDFAGGLISTAFAWRTTTAPDGLHTITARVTFKNATTARSDATFTVDN